MKFCPNCGTKLDNDNFKFCPECGYNFESNSSNSDTKDSGGLISSFIKGIRNEVQDNEMIDDMVTHAKIIWHGPQTEKEKAFKERKRQEEEKKDPVKYKISEVTGKHLSDSSYFTERKKLFNVTDGYTYYKDILKFEVKNNALEYEDIEARLDELLRINDARTIFELRLKRPTYLFKTREDLEQYIGYGTAKNPIPIADEEIEKLTEKGFDRSAALKKILSEEKLEKKYGLQREEISVKKKVDNNINQGTEKPKETPAATTKKAISTKQKTYEPDYSKLELSDLQETLIKTLPIINNPSEYEENIINKYAEYNSDERKELLKDCWTVTKLANEHNIKRQEVQKEILTDEFLEKNLIGVFKVNPNNIRSLKILYRKPLTETQQPQENKQLKKEKLDEIKEEPVLVVKNIEKENQKEKNSTPTKVIQNNKTDKENKKQKESRKKGLFGRNSSEKKEFEKKLEELCGGILPNDAFDKKAREHGTLTGIGGTPPANTNYKKILKAEFKAGTLKVDDVENRLDELFDLDVDQLERKVRMKKEDTSVFKTQEDLNNRFGEEYAEKFRRKDKEYRKGALFEEYGINAEEAYCFECTIEERRSSTFTNTDRRNVDRAYVALFDDYIAIIKESVWLKSNMGMRKVYFNNVTSIDYDTAGKLGMSPSLFIHMHSGEHVQLKFITKENVAEVQNRFENYTNEKNNNAGTVQINQETSNADELLKYAELYKQGLLTDEEFAAMKNKLINGT